MKLNPHILTSTIALLTCAAFAAEPTAPVTESSATSTTVTSKGGKATITIDVNGKKETREIEIGKGVEIEAGTPPKMNVPAHSITRVKTITRSTWMGVAADEVSEELRAQLPIESGAGLIVRSVIPDSPAAAANLQKNDVLLKLDDQLLTNPQQLRTLVGAKKDGDIVKVTYLRRGQESTTDVKLAMHEDREIASETPVLSLEKLFQNRGWATNANAGPISWIAARRCFELWAVYASSIMCHRRSRGSGIIFARTRNAFATLLYWTMATNGSSHP